MTAKYFHILNVLLITGAVCLSAKLLYKITTTHLDYVYLKKENTQKVSTPAGETYQPLSYYQTIIKRNLFNTKKAVVTKPEKINIESFKKTDLKLKLWGTVTGDSDRSYAVIEETTKRKQKLYKEGDVIQNAIVKVILRGMVVLRVNDKDEIIEIEKVQRSIIRKDASVNAKNEYSGNALMDACNRGHKEVVGSLIAEGVDVNAQDNYGDTALMNAARSGHSEIVELLVANGADVHRRNYWGNTALIDSAKYASKLTYKVIAILIANGADVNAKNMHGNTALINAARRGHSKTVELLIANGADVNAQSISGETALKVAAYSLQKDVAEVLMTHGAKEQ